MWALLTDSTDFNSTMTLSSTMISCAESFIESHPTPHNRNGNLAINLEAAVGQLPGEDGLVDALQQPGSQLPVHRDRRIDNDSAYLVLIHHLTHSCVILGDLRVFARYRSLDHPRSSAVPSLSSFNVQRPKRRRRTPTPTQRLRNASTLQPGPRPPRFNTSTSTLLRGVPPQIPLPTGNGTLEAASGPFPP